MTETMPTTVSEPRTRRTAMLCVLLVGQFMALLDVTIVNVAVPTIGTDLGASGAELQLVVGGYSVAYAMLLITGARLGDNHGRRRMYLVGAAFFTAASLACGLALSGVVLIAARVVQGAGAAMLVPQVISIIQTHFRGRERAAALSAYAVVLSVGAVAGMLLGGVLVAADLFSLGWRPVFFVNVPLGVLLLVLVPVFVPADRPTRQRRLDVPGLLVVVPAMVLVVLPLVLAHETGWTGFTVGALVLGGLLAVTFVGVERNVGQRGGNPLLNLAVLRAPGMSAGLLGLLCMQVTYGGGLFVFTVHQQADLGHGALRVALTYLPMVLTFGLVGFFWRRLPTRWQPFLAPVGLGLCAVSFPALTSSGYLWPALALWGAGMGASASPLMAQALTEVPPANAADASGLLATTMQFGQVTGVALFGSMFFSLADASGRAAFTSTALWMSALALLGVVAGTFLTRVVVRRGA